MELPLSTDFKRGQTLAVIILWVGQMVFTFFCSDFLTKINYLAKFVFVNQFQDQNQCVIIA